MKTVDASKESVFDRAMRLCMLLAACTCFVFCADLSHASTITLTWDAETAADLAGYRVYYSQSAALPFQGTGAVQGASPVDVSTSNVATITGLDPGTPYYFAITAYNSTGLETGYSTIVQVPELIPPSVALSSPAVNASVTGKVSVGVAATDNVGVTRVDLYLNGQLLATQTQAPYLFTWDTAALSSGSYTLSAKAYDAAGNEGVSAPVAVTLLNDTTAPSVALGQPVGGLTLGGVQAVTANASDNVGVSRVEFYLDGGLVAANNVPPYGFSWNTLTAANGSHTLSALAYDAAGNVGQSAAVGVTVFNDVTSPVVSLTAPATGATVGGLVSVTAGASDNVGVSRVEFYLNGVLQATRSVQPYIYSWDSTSVANGSYTWSAQAYDSAGNAGQSAGVTVTVSNDLTAPSVSAFSLPASSTSLTVPVSLLSATDNVGVTGYLVTESAIAPAAGAAGWSVTPPASFTFSGAGTRTAYAWARDAAGNVSASRSATVVITLPDLTAPVITLLSPAAGSTVGASVVVSATATDNVAVNKMRLYIDNSLKAKSNSGTLTYTWNTGSYAKGAHSIKVIAYDAAGNAATRTITVYK